MLEIFFHHKLVMILAFVAPLTLKRPLLCSRKRTVTTAKFKGQMWIGKRSWCDYVLYTKRGIHVQRICFDEVFWNQELLPKLTSFYDNCVSPEIVSPLHALGHNFSRLKGLSILLFLCNKIFINRQALGTASSSTSATILNVILYILALIY